MDNGVQILLVERPGIKAFHARMALSGGRSDTGVLPAASAELLARTLYGSPLRDKVDPKLEALLRQEEGLCEALRLEKMRRKRLEGGESAPEEKNLSSLREKCLSELKARLEAAGPDRLEQLGALSRRVVAQADAIHFSLDLPKSAFEQWLELEFHRLSRLDGSYFPFVKAQFLEEIQQGRFEKEKQRSVVYNTALAGWSYAQVAEHQAGSLEAITWSDMRELASRLVSPDRLKLILVGDLKLDAIMPVLKKTLGKLGVPAHSAPRKGDAVQSMEASAGNRRMQANLPGASILYMAWRVPSSNHPDEIALKLMSTVLESRLRKRLLESTGDRRLADSVEIALGVPGWRMDCLLMVEAVPAKGHSLQALEEAIHGEALRITRELAQEDELRKGQRMMEAEPLLCQEDAASLSEVLANALVESGDWRRAFQDQNLGRAITALEVQTVARRYLTPERSTVVLLEPDPLLNPKDAIEERLAKALAAILAKRVEDPAKAENIVRDTLRQLRMLSGPERERTLKLLESGGRK